MRQVLLHAHIFKNAGTTLDWSLRRSFGSDFLSSPDEERMRSRGRACLADLLTKQPGLKALSSHHMPCVAPDAGAGISYHRLHLLRHPFSRALSVYSFERRQNAQTPGAMAAKQLELPEYLHWRMEPDVPGVLRNYQTAYIMGCHRPVVDSQEMAALFPGALEQLSRLRLVGLVERFDESMVLFETLLRPIFPALDLAYQPQNQSPVMPITACASQPAVTLETMGDAATSVVENNAYDLALYRLAENKFHRAITAIAGFEEKLRDFKDRCTVLHAP